MMSEHIGKFAARSVARQALFLCGLALSVGTPAMASTLQEPPREAGVVDGMVAVSAKEVTEGGRHADRKRKLSFMELLASARALIEGGSPEKAMELLEPLELEHAGEVEYDVLLGISAMDSGYPDRASMSFERVLLVDPNRTQARMDLARCYFQTGDFARARTEFEAVIGQHPDSSTASIALNYINSIKGRDQGRVTQFRGYMDVGGGYDSNANNATSQSQLMVLGVLPVTLAPTSVKTSSGYEGMAVGGDVSRPFTVFLPEWTFHVGADAADRHNFGHGDLDISSLNAIAGLGYEKGSDKLGVDAVGGQNTLGGARSFLSRGVQAQWEHGLSPRNKVQLFGQSFEYSYSDPAFTPNDFNQQVMGFGWSHTSDNGNASFFSRAFHGRGMDTSTLIASITPQGGSVDGNEVFNGTQTGCTVRLGSHVLAFTRMLVSSGNYDRVNPFFAAIRHDRFYNMGAGVDWSVGQGWVLRPQADYTRNDSSLDIYSFERMDVSLTLHRDFK